MATLNTLRTRGGIIVTIVIGVALLAFLLGDLAGSADNMMNSRKMRVGEINGQKIGYMEYSEQIDYFTNIDKMMSNSESQSTEDVDRIREMAWQNMIATYALLPGLQQVGLTVSENEQVDMVTGTNISPVIMGVFSDPSTGAFDQALLSRFVSNISTDASGRTAYLWNYFKDQMNRQRAIAKFTEVVAKGMYSTDLEIEQAVAQANTASDIEFVMKEYAQVADSTIRVTDSEIRAYYNDHKKMFRQGASRDIEYVLFNVIPSAEDYAEAERVVGEMAAEFAESAAPFQFAVLQSQVQPTNTYQSSSQMNSDMAAFAFGPHSDGMYGPVMTGDTYVLARVADTKMLPDSIGAKHILLAADQTALADSLVTVLKRNPGEFAALSAEFSVDQAANAQGGDLGVFMPEMMIPEFSNAVVNARVGEIVKVTTPYGLHVVELTYKSPLAQKVQLAQITYRVEPSDATQQQIYGEASKFITAASGSYARFNTAVTEEGQSKRAARIRSTDREVTGMENSREIVRWAFTSKEGAVSQIMEVDGNYIVVALTGATEDGTAPVDKVAGEIATTLRQEKKAQQLADQMAGSASLADAASKLGAEIQASAGINFNAFYLDNVGVEPQLIGAVTAMQPNRLSKPVKGSSGVFLFQVTNRSSADNTDFENAKVYLDASAQSYISERLNEAITDVSHITDNRMKLF